MSAKRVRGLARRLTKAVRARLENLPQGWYTDFFGRWYFPRSETDEDSVWTIRLPWLDRQAYEKGSDVWFPEDGENLFVFNAAGDTRILSLVQAVDSSPKARLKRSGDFVMESPPKLTPSQAWHMQLVSKLIGMLEQEGPVKRPSYYTTP